MDWFVDPARGRWLQDRIPQLGMMVPSDMPAYARILHPVFAYRAADETIQMWRWEDVAARNSVVMDAASQWSDITAEGAKEEWPDGWSVGCPIDGQIDPDFLASIVPTLAAHTSRPDDITLGVWEGWGFGGAGTVLYRSTWDDDDASPEPAQDPIAAERAATDPRLIEMDEFGRSAFSRYQRTGVVPEFRLPLLELPDRRYVLGSTTLTDLADPEWVYASGLGWAPEGIGGTMPQLIWPADEAWCVSIEVDAPYTVVAGSVEFVRALLSASSVEGHAIREPDYS